MNEVILLKMGELALKGQNRASFEDALIRNARRRLKSCGDFGFTKAQSTIYVTPKEGSNSDLAEATRRLTQVFGIAGISRSAVVPKDFEAIKAAAVDYLSDQLRQAKTFKVVAKRADKRFAMKSPEICAELGGHILEAFPHLDVHMTHPDITVTAEIRDFGAYVHADQLPGAGGIPVGTAGQAALLISGGIDSPVAGYMLARRGLAIDAIHFASPPYTSDRALLKVMMLLQTMARYTGRIYLTVVNFTEIQEEIARNCPEEYSTLIMRRFMMEIASKIARDCHCEALITGESLGQVASQTIQAITCTEAAATMPVFRPLIGMDKNDIVRVARHIETFSTSTLPYEDCCTVFTPKHPRTKPKLDYVQKAEASLDREGLIARALAAPDTVVIYEDTDVYSLVFGPIEP